MKLKIEEEWAWLAVARNGDQYFHLCRPKAIGLQWVGGDIWEVATIFADLKSGGLYERRGDEWYLVENLED